MANGQSKKSKKWGRNANECKAYSTSNRREKNKLVRLAKHLKNHPDDPAAKAAVEAASRVIRGY